MMFIAEKSGYPMDALSPEISGYTMLFHFEGIYAGYIEKLNALIENDSRLKNVPLEKLLGSSSEKIRYYAGAVYVHRMYFSGLSPEKKEVPEIVGEDKIFVRFV